MYYLVYTRNSLVRNCLLGNYFVGIICHTPAKTWYPDSQPDGCGGWGVLLSSAISYLQIVMRHRIHWFCETPRLWPAFKRTTLLGIFASYSRSSGLPLRRFTSNIFDYPSHYLHQICLVTLHIFCCIKYSWLSLIFFLAQGYMVWLVVNGLVCWAQIYESKYRFLSLIKRFSFTSMTRWRAYSSST